MRTFHINSFVSVTTKEVTLSLCQVRWQRRSAISIKIVQTATKSGTRDAMVGTSNHDSPPRINARIQLCCNQRVHHQIFQIRIGSEGVLNFVEELCSNDATSLPKANATRNVDLPIICIRGTLDNCKPLSIGTDLCRI